MKRNIKLIIEYDGSRYHGWQQQPDVLTIQGEIKSAIYRLTKQSPIIYGSGRTDAGVHAYGQVANFHIESNIPGSAFAKAINAYLPVDIAVKESVEVDCNFHAQFSAKAKAYSYNIIATPIRPALGVNYAHWVWRPLTIEEMQKGSQYLLGTHDFSSFQAANSPRQSNVRTVNYIDICRENCYIKVCIEANGFLYKMVRNIVGTLITAGQKRIKPEHIKKILIAKNRKFAGATVPAKGLFLKYVRY